jgi:hypothetical protein
MVSNKITSKEEAIQYMVAAKETSMKEAMQPMVSKETSLTEAIKKSKASRMKIWEEVTWLFVLLISTMNLKL